MSDERQGNPPDAPFRQMGIGLHITRMCMGCNGKRSAIGGRGTGLRWRCAGCVAARLAA